jgi:phage-related holin
MQRALESNEEKCYMTGQTMLVTMLLLLLLVITWAILSPQVFNMLHFAPNWMEVIKKQ